MEDRMYGVVLWADAKESKAVIWCEDQGNLAYYTAAGQTVHDGVSLDAGDLIQFDLQETAEYRSARNPERVGAGYAPGLAQSLRGKAGPAAAAPRDNIVQFPGPRA